MGTWQTGLRNLLGTPNVIIIQDFKAVNHILYCSSPPSLPIYNGRPDALLTIATINGRNATSQGPCSPRPLPRPTSIKLQNITSPRPARQPPPPPPAMRPILDQPFPQLLHLSHRRLLLRQARTLRPKTRHLLLQRLPTSRHPTSREEEKTEQRTRCLFREQHRK